MAEGYRIAILRARERTERTGKCEICGRFEEHVSGMVRGDLCRQCNSWLGVFEANLKRVWQRGKKNYKLWADQNRLVITEYLKQNKGFLYRNRHLHR